MNNNQKDIEDETYKETIDIVTAAADSIHADNKIAKHILINQISNNDDFDDFDDFDDVDDDDDVELIPDEDIDFGFTLARFPWLDQYRGLVMLLFIISLITFALSGNIFTSELPVGPTYLNHGYMLAPNYYFSRGENYPYIITLIDLGQGVLIFLIGFMQSYSYKKRLKIAGKANANSHIFYRSTIFFIISIVMYDIILNWGWYEALFNGTVAIIGWSSLSAPIAVKGIKSTKKKLLLSMIILMIHFILYSIPSIRTWEIGEGRNYFTFPFLTLNMIAISIMGAVYQEWFFNERGEVNKEGIKKNVIPNSFIFFAVGYILGYIQWAYQPRCTSALAFLIIGWAGITIFFSYAIVEMGVILKPLQIIGENMFVVFFIAPLIALILPEYIEEIVRENKFAALFFAGILPIMIIYLICWILHRKRLTIKI